MSKYYAGIGSRNAPADILDLMTQIAKILSEQDYVLRSGDAKGSDKAFAKGATKKELFKSKDAMPWAYDEVKTCMPIDRTGFDYWTPYVKGLLARNMMQILGKNGDQPVEFVFCWAPSLIYTDSSAGGTAYAIRCAMKHNIPVHNMFDENQLKLIKEKYIK